MPKSKNRKKTTSRSKKPRAVGVEQKEGADSPSTDPPKADSFSVNKGESSHKHSLLVRLVARILFFFRSIPLSRAIFFTPIAAGALVSSGAETSAFERVFYAYLAVFSIVVLAESLQKISTRWQRLGLIIFCGSVGGSMLSFSSVGIGWFVGLYLLIVIFYLVSVRKTEDSILLRAFFIVSSMGGMSIWGVYTQYYEKIYPQAFFLGLLPGFLGAAAFILEKIHSFSGSRYQRERLVERKIKVKKEDKSSDSVKEEGGILSEDKTEIVGRPGLLSIVLSLYLMFGPAFIVFLTMASIVPMPFAAILLLFPSLSDISSKFYRKEEEIWLLTDRTRGLFCFVGICMFVVGHMASS